MIILEDQLLIHELAERAGVSVRTIRYYIAEGLLPAPTTRGRYAYYSQEYLDLIELIRRLKDAYLPLREIRALVLNLPAEKVQEVLEQSAGLPQEELLRNVRELSQQYQTDKSEGFGPELQPELTDDTAANYVRRIMDQGSAGKPIYPARSENPGQRNKANPIPSPIDEVNQKLNHEKFVTAPPGESVPQFSMGDQTTWRRYEIAPGVEIHIETHVYQKYQERIRRLIKLARDLLNT